MHRWFGVVLIVVAACSGKVTSSPTGASSGVTTAPPCAGPLESRPTSPACGGEVRTCDPYRPAGLPSGACTAGATCDVTVRALCACADEDGPRFPYRCGCTAGEWRCELQPPDGRTCTNACLDAGVADATTDGGACPPKKKPEPPGPRATSASTKGTGACASKTLGEVIAAIHAAKPALADIMKIYDPATTMFDGSFVYAFAIADGFAVALKRGGGDCPAGCTENEYWYFVTEGGCALKPAGHYHPTYASTCIDVVGSPMWATPMPLDPASMCGASTTAEDISGTYTVCASGSRTACSEKAGAEPTLMSTTNLTFVVAQRPDDLTKGTVTIKGIGHPRIEGVPFDATFTRRRFSVAKSVSVLPAKCIDDWSLGVELDFESYVPGRLRFHETRSLGCSETSGGGTYCKGQIAFDLVGP